MLTTLVLIAGLQGVVIHEQVRVQAPDGSTESGWQRTIVAGSHIRREASSRPIVILLDGDKRETITLDHSTGTFFRVSADELAVADAPGPFMDGIGVNENGDAFAPKKAFKPTGRTRTIGDWKTREVEATAIGPGGDRTRQWIADRPAGLPNNLYSAIAERVFSREGSQWTPYFSQVKALKGFPVETTLEFSTPQGAMRVTLTVTKIERREIPDSAFRAPKGYTQTPNPLADAEAH